MSLADFAHAVSTFCLMFDGSVTSWGRTAKHNADVGGVAISAHRFFLAADVIYDAPLSEAARKTLAGRLGLRCIVEGDHDHLQPENWPAG